MRQFLILLILSLTCYFLWQYIRIRDRNEFRKFLNGHGQKVFGIIAALTIILVAQFYLNSTKLL
jgi:hypothetical protein